MGGTLLVAMCLVGLTPEQEVEAWQPPVAQAEEPRTPSEAAVRATTVLVPLGAIVVGGAAGIGASAAFNAVGIDGTVAAWAGLATGVGAFEALLALGLHAFLPPGLPSWTIPVAALSATAAGAGGLALGAGLSFAYVSVVYAGSDCYCAQDLLLVPVVVGGLTALGAAAGTTLSVIAAEME